MKRTAKAAARSSAPEFSIPEPSAPEFSVPGSFAPEFSAPESSLPGSSARPPQTQSRGAKHAAPQLPAQSGGPKHAAPRRKAPARPKKKDGALGASFQMPFKRAASPSPKAGARKRGNQTGAPGFALKLTLAMLLVLTLALSLGGTVLLAGNFSDSLNEAAQQAEAQHLLQCYALESNLLDVAARGETVTDSHLARYGSTLADYTGGRMAAIFCAPADAAAARTSDTSSNGPAASEGGDPALPENDDPTAPESETALRQVYSSFPWEAAPSGREDAYRMHRADGKTYMLFETSVHVGGAPAVTLLTGHDVTDVLTARNRALLRFWEMELVVLACAGAVIALLSRWLTRPLARLTEASESIAAGAYGERTGLSGGDEIGILSRSFDTMAAAIEEKVAALELSVRQREDFMSAFSHELKTPMTAVIGFADTLRSVQCEPEEQRRAAGYIYSEAQRVESLSQKLLQLLGLSDAPPVLAPVALEEIILRTHRALASFIAPVKLKARPAPGVLVMGDADLLTDLVYNLVWNAVRAKPKDGYVHLKWQWAGDGAAVDLTVWDTGCGIPPEAIERVTEPFFMEDKSRARAGGGSGIGLALCKKIAEVHGGSLHIESTLGEGSAVTVRLAAAPGQMPLQSMTEEVQP